MFDWLNEDKLAAKRQGLIRATRNESLKELGEALDASDVDDCRWPLSMIDAQFGQSSRYIDDLVILDKAIKQLHNQRVYVESRLGHKQTIRGRWERISTRAVAYAGLALAIISLIVAIGGLQK